MKNEIYVCQLTFKNGYMDIQASRLSAFTSVKEIKDTWDAEPDAWEVLKVAKAGRDGKLSTFKTLIFNDNGDLCKPEEISWLEPGKQFYSRKTIPGKVIYARE